MIYNLFFLIDSLFESFMLRYRKFVFMARTGNRVKDFSVLGSFSVSRAKSVKIGQNVTIYPNVSFSGGGEITIGDNVQIGEGTIVYSHNKVEIGNNVAIAGQCYIIDCNHGTAKYELIQKQALEYHEEGISIGNDVWIAAGCKIVKGACIKNGVVIGAMSLVNSEIEENAIAIGIPAVVRRFRE
jgi:acetyltransferase-like isoleucine patch superfamily enzyme